MYWGLSIVEKENKSIDILLEDKKKEVLLKLLKKNLQSYSVEDSNFYKQVIERYEVTATIFEKIFDINFDVYVSTKQSFLVQNKELSQLQAVRNSFSIFESLRLNKPDASSNTIDDICSRMSKERFLVRPSYQRKEVIDRYKSSAIIESILLGIKLPPVFIYKRNDGVAEVLDGQQRLLSILGFLGRSFMDENKVFVPSEKNNYTLRKLNILKDVNGKKFDEIPTHYQDRILDFDLWVVEINEKTNPDFDPIDLFIRLNYKPFPILENTFEMWNSYVDREIIDTIKNIYKKYQNWFFVRVDNRRMENESLLTYLSFLELQTKIMNGLREAPVNFDIYKSSAKVNIRILNKSEITQVLDDPSNKANFLESCKNLERNFILKLKILLSVDGKEDDETLKTELDSLLSISKLRRFQSFYSLWYILLNVSEKAIRENKVALREAIHRILQDMKNQRGVNSFSQEVANLHVKNK